VVDNNNEMKKNEKIGILLISPFFYPEPISTGKYNTYLARALVRKGCSVEVVASHPIYPDWKPKRSAASLEGVKIYRGGGFFVYPNSVILRRIQLELGFTIHALRGVFFNRNSTIFVLVFPPSLFFLFVRFLIPQSAQRIGIVHDLQGVLAELSNSLPRRIVSKFIGLVEKRIFNTCDKLIFVSKSMASRAINEYGLKPKKVLVRYPFVTLIKTGNGNALGHLFPSGYKHIVYSGAIGEKQNPKLLLKLFAAIVKKKMDVLCHIFSRGPMFDELRKGNASKFERVAFHDLVPEKDLFELYLKSDIQIIPQKEGSSVGAIPSKLSNIISAGVPIFAISDPESELSEIIGESGIGYCAGSWNVDKLVIELDNFLEKTGRHSHQERQRTVSDFVTRNFEIDQLVQVILSERS